jgi:hypothetical protein
MNRRGFFKLLASGLAVPEELLVPTKSIFLAPIGGWIHNGLVITPELLVSSGIISRYSGYDVIFVPPNEVLKETDMIWSQRYGGHL